MSSFSLGPSFASEMVIDEIDPIDYEQLIAEQKEKLWQIGDDRTLSVGDSYTYKICDPAAFTRYSAENYHYFTKGYENHNNSMCYLAQMTFENLRVR